LNSFIKNYCGIWKNDSGERLEIEYLNEHKVLVSFYRLGSDLPIIRPWCGDKPATNMIGTLDEETQGSLDIDLSNGTNSLCLNLSFDFTDSSYKSCSPSIIRNETQAFLNQYYHLLGSLKQYEKC